MKKLVLIFAAVLLLSGCATVGSDRSENDIQSNDAKKIDQGVVSNEQGVASEDNLHCDLSWLSRECRFGQTARYEDSRRDGTVVVLDVTVQKPKQFTPGKDAEFDLKVLGGEPAEGPDSLYFDIEITNRSEEAIVDDQDIELSANSSTDSDFDVRRVDDGDVQSLWEFELEPGQSSKVRSGWNFSDATNPTMEIRIDGLGGGGGIEFSENE